MAYEDVTDNQTIGKKQDRPYIYVASRNKPMALITTVLLVSMTVIFTAFWWNSKPAEESEDPPTLQITNTQFMHNSIVVSNISKGSSTPTYVETTQTFSEERNLTAVKLHFMYRARLSGSGHIWWIKDMTVRSDGVVVLLDTYRQQLLYLNANYTLLTRLRAPGTQEHLYPARIHHLPMIKHELITVNTDSSSDGRLFAISQNYEDQEISVPVIRNPLALSSDHKGNLYVSDWDTDNICLFRVIKYRGKVTLTLQRCVLSPVPPSHLCVCDAHTLVVGYWRSSSAVSLTITGARRWSLNASLLHRPHGLACARGCVISANEGGEFLLLLCDVTRPVTYRPRGLRHPRALTVDRARGVLLTASESGELFVFRLYPEQQV